MPPSKLVCACDVHPQKTYIYFRPKKKLGWSLNMIYSFMPRDNAPIGMDVFFFWAHNVVAYIYLSVPSRTLFMKDISCMRIDERMQSEESCASSANICGLCAHAKCEWQAHANLAQICTIFCARRVLSRVFQGHTAKACVAHNARYARYYIIHNILFI